ncbi:MAG: trypsin-like serine protease [Proteobacteria bacterium]|nr:trypsin-like serine protease [Pseudomonadota bacterium]MCP4917959.1 trypsin-like serine protease [Pseudomonadota bacterium]
MIHLLTTLAFAQDAKIINGEPASWDDYPMTGATILDAYLDMGSWGAGPVRTLSCSSTLIAPDVVLLAAHCVDPDSYTYGYGTLEDIDIRWSRSPDLTAHTTGAKAQWPNDAIAAWDWTMHPEWDLFSMDVGIAENYDIALLFLDEPSDAPFAYLPTADEALQLEEGSEVAVVGWGQQEQDGEVSGEKMMGFTHIAELGDAEMQIGAEKNDVRKCHGDSGGPSFFWAETESLETMRLVGVTSHAYDDTDCKKKGGVDTRVDAYLEWIDAELTARCEDGSRSWCEEYGIPELPMPEPEPEPVDEEEKPGLFGCASGELPVAPLGLVLLAGLAIRRRD